MRPVESGLLLLLESIRILEEDRPPGKSRYTSYADPKIWKKGEALVSIFSAGAAIECLLKQLLIEEGINADEAVRTSLQECINQTRVIADQKDRKFLNGLRLLRNQAIHSGEIDVRKARNTVADVVKFVVTRYFEKMLLENNLNEMEHEIYFRIKLTANEFTEYNMLLDRETAATLAKLKETEFLWVCMICDQQSVRVKSEEGVCLRCGITNYGFGAFVGDVLNVDELQYAGRSYAVSAKDTTDCKSCQSARGLDLDEIDGTEILHICADCDSITTSERV